VTKLTDKYYYIDPDGNIGISFTIPLATLYLSSSPVNFFPKVFAGTAEVVINIVTLEEDVAITFDPSIIWSTIIPTILNANSDYILVVNADKGKISASWKTSSDSGTYNEFNDLTDAVTWADVPDDNITESSVIQHEEALNVRNFWNGTFLETFDARESSAAGVVTCTVTNPSGGNLTMRFSDGVTTLTAPATIALTVGTTQVPVNNFIYIPLSTKVLTKSTTAWPSEEHIKVSFFLCQSAADVLSDGGCYINQNHNDHLSDTALQGHLSHITAWIRRQGAVYFSGIEPNGTTSYLTIAAGDIRFKSTAGVVSQLHLHTFLEKDTTTDIAHVVNWSGDAYHNVQNLYDIVADSAGGAIGVNQWFALFIWGAANKTGQYDPIFINLPSGKYVSEAAAIADANLYTNTTITREYIKDSGTGFPICLLYVQKRATTWAYGSTIDLR
jgi:hypothetical protein